MRGYLHSRTYSKHQPRRKSLVKTSEGARKRAHHRTTHELTSSIALCFTPHCLFNSNDMLREGHSIVWAAFFKVPVCFPTFCWMPCLSANAQMSGPATRTATGRIAPSIPISSSLTPDKEGGRFTDRETSSFERGNALEWKTKTGRFDRCVWR